MESVIEETAPTMRKRVKLIIRKPIVGKLKALVEKIPDESMSEFKARYGKIADLLNVDVQENAIFVMAQYYDSPLRCFTFSNFQLAPTLEEFAHILGQPLGEGKPYHFQGDYPRVETVASALGVDARLLDNKRDNKDTQRGIPRTRLEELMNSLVERQSWEILIDVLALSIYDIVLFPSAGDFVGAAAMDVFMARKCRQENSSHAVLADVYYTMSFSHDKKGKRLKCCIPALYVWIITHIFPQSYEARGPFGDVKMLGLKPLSLKEWVHVFSELHEDSVRWYPKWMKTKEVICQCGDFPNVPLIGTLGCINYNPILSLRQLNYAMKDQPAETSTTPFMTDFPDGEMLGRIWRAWGNVVCKAYEFGKRGCGASSHYKQWVRNRAEAIQIPFQKPSMDTQQDTDNIAEESEDLKEMRKKLAKVQAEKDALEEELREIRSSFQTLKLEHGEKAQSLEQVNKRARVEKASLDRTKVCLRSANRELGFRNAEKNKAIWENERLKESLRNKQQQLDAVKNQLTEQNAQYELARTVDERAFLDAIQGYQNQLENEHMEVDKLSKERDILIEENWNLKGEVVNLERARDEIQQCMNTLEKQMDEIIARYEAKIRSDRQDAREAANLYRATLERKNEEIRGLGQWAAERDHYMGLVRTFEENFSHARHEISRWTYQLRDVERIPELVRHADAAINPITTPREVINLIDACKSLVEETKKLIRSSREN